MIKQQVDVIIHVVHRDPLLTSYKGESNPKLQYETLQFSQDRRFKIPFAIAILQAKEIKKIGVAKNQIGCEFIL